MSELPTIYTGRLYSYPMQAKVKRDELVPVRITAGFPRGVDWLHEHLPGLAPDRGTLNLEQAPFHEALRVKMEKGWSETLAELHAIAGRHPGKALVLLCFENLAEEGVWCHRTMVAEFITEKTGVAVTELVGKGEAG